LFRYKSYTLLTVTSEVKVHQASIQSNGQVPALEKKETITKCLFFQVLKNKQKKILLETPW